MGRPWKFVIGTLVVVLIVGLYFIIAPRFSENKQELTAGKSPEEIITAVKDKQEIESFKYRSQVKAGDSIAVNLIGRFIRDGNEEMVDLSWEGPQGNGESSLYITGNRIFAFHPQKNVWLAPGEDRALGQLINMLKNQLNLVNPYKSLQRINLDKVKAVNTGTETVDGHEAVVIEISPGKEASDWFSGLLPPQLIGAKVAEVKQIYWIGNRDLNIYKYLLTAEIKIFGLQLMDFQAHTTVNDYNKTTITLPAELEKKLTSSS